MFMRYIVLEEIRKRLKSLKTQNDIFFYISEIYIHHMLLNEILKFNRSSVSVVFCYRVYLV